MSDELSYPTLTAGSRRGIATSTWAVLLLMLLTISVVLLVDWRTALPADIERAYVGTATCMTCHVQEGTLWKGSHHDLAMDLATDQTVLGDFNDQSITHHGITTRLFRDGDRYMVHTEGPDGAMDDFEVKYVFGVDPLQQYMVELQAPTSDASDASDALGRIQVLRVSWDTHRKKWFYLDAPDVSDKLEPNDPLHWTGSAQNWNHMCADCHSTNLQKNFDVASLSYHTTFSEIDVGCEACHGPGSLHVSLAQARSLFWDRRHGTGLTRMKNADPDIQIHACSKCHSRRALVQAGSTCGANYYDHYNNQLLSESTYYPDGQIRDEVYVMGSFLQSKMYAKGIRCTDCHDPHSAKLKHEGNRVCTSCHQHDPAKYDTPAHHHHKAGSPGASCVECHMMETVYMAVDERRDHSFQIPRPDLSVTLKTPNACTKCHLTDAKISDAKRNDLPYYAQWLQAARDGDEEVAAELSRLDQWSAETVSQWYAGKSPSSASEQSPRIPFAPTLHRAWQHDPAVLRDLLELAQDRRVPGIIRASAVTQLAQLPWESIHPVAKKSLSDKDPQVRAAGVALYPSANEASVRELAPMLEDSTRLVRVQAARALAGCKLTTLSREQRDAMKLALQDYQEALRVDADLSGSHMADALLAESFQDWRRAEAAYRRAIKVMPGVMGPRTNLAALLDRLQRPAEAASLRKEELELMIRDARLAPDHAWLQYRLGLGLYLAGRYAQAEEALKRSVELEPNIPDFPVALALLYQKQGRLDEALALCEKAVRLDPTIEGNQNLRDELRQAVLAKKARDDSGGN